MDAPAAVSYAHLTVLVPAQGHYCPGTEGHVRRATRSNISA